MDPWHILLQVLLLLGGALLLGTLAARIRQSAILGFLLAGTLVGPSGLGLVKEGSHLALIAELGVALLLFTIGLEFSIGRLRKLGSAALLGGIAQITVTLLVVFLTARLFGLSARAAFTLGAVTALSSTATVLRILTDSSALERPYGRLTLGILLIQDVAVFPLALVVSIISREGGSAGEIAWELLRTLAAAGVLIAAFLFLFNWLVPRLLNIRQWSLNREFPILLAIIVALGSAALAHVAGISPAIGAFLSGVLLGESVFSSQIRADVAALRAVLVTFFFASVGLQFDPGWTIAHWQIVLSVAICVILGKAVLVWVVLKLMRARHDTALATGFCLAQVGEFAFVLVGIAAEGSVFDRDMMRLIVSVTIITLFAAPFLVSYAPDLAGHGVVLLRLRRKANATADASRRKEGDSVPIAEPAPRSGHIIVVGLGPAAQQFLEALSRNSPPQITIIDLNPRAAEVAERYGAQLHIGHAGHPDVLEEAGLEHASAVVITVPDPVTAVDVVLQCRNLQPKIRIIARARYHLYCQDLRDAGADEVVDEEYAVGHALAVALLSNSSFGPASAAS
ncbi:MAG: cation:proton antiporter [Candidatus Sumerlaeaceae bacterium]